MLNLSCSFLLLVDDFAEIAGVVITSSLQTLGRVLSLTVAALGIVFDIVAIVMVSIDVHKGGFKMSIYIVPI